MCLSRVCECPSYLLVRARRAHRSRGRHSSLTRPRIDYQDGPQPPPDASGDGVPDRPAARHVLPPGAAPPSSTRGGVLPPRNHAQRRPSCGPRRRARVPVPAVAALVACAGGLLPRAARAQNPLYTGRVLAPSGAMGTERGITLEVQSAGCCTHFFSSLTSRHARAHPRAQDERFWPGTTGSEWPKPEGTDQARIEQKDGALHFVQSLLAFYKSVRLTV